MNIDEAIDQAARSLIDADPPATLRTGVQARLEGTSTRRWLWPAVFAGATAAAAIVVLALVWPDTDAVERVNTPTTAVAEKPPLPFDPAAAGSTAGASETTERVAVPRGAGNIARTRTVPVEPVEPTVQIDVIDVMPVDIEPLEIPMIAVDSLDVGPLVMQQ